MSKLAKTMKLPDLNRLERIAESPFERELIQLMKSLYDDFQTEHKAIFEFAEAGGASTANWSMKEATAADVADGNAVAAGNLLTVHKTSGTKREVEV